VNTAVREPFYQAFVLHRVQDSLNAFAINNAYDTCEVIQNIG
jgi:hypothetical protein